MKRAIITGASGALGTALVKELVQNGTEVLILFRENSKRKQNIISHPLVTKKACSLNQLQNLQNDTGKDYDVFFHLAWDGTMGLSRNDMYLQNRNVVFALDALQAAHRMGCHTFIGAGSQAEYGRFQGLLKADTPLVPENGYGIAKLCAGLMTREMAKQLGIRHMWIRILSIYGPNDNPQSMVMSTISKLKNGIIPEFTKGEQVWDYLFSEDAARAFRLVAEHGTNNKVYVLGSGIARPLADYIEIIRGAVDKNAEIKLGALPYAVQQVMYLCADISDLETDVGFHPQISFPEGIRKTLSL